MAAVGSRLPLFLCLLFLKKPHDRRSLCCVAVCCSVLQCVAMCCSVLQRVAACCSVLQCVAMWRGVAQCGADM